MDDPLDKTILRSAKEPRHAANDGESVENRPISELIAAENHLASKQAKRRNHCGLSFRRIEPGGCG